jgi:uncharacterized protein (TIGR02246 family)
MSIERSRQVARDFVEALSRGDGDAIADAFTDDGVAWTLGSLSLSGTHPRDEIRRLSAEILRAFPKGLRFSIRSLTAEGDRVAVEAESDGVHASGRHYHNTYHFLIRVRDGKIAELREYLDTALVQEVLLGGAGPVAPGGPDANRALVLDYLDAMRRGDHAHAWEAFAEDATWSTAPSMPWPAHFRGRREIFDGYFAVDKGLFTTGMSSYDLETTNVVAAGECVVVEMRHRATGLNGRVYDTEHCLVFTVRGERIQAVREYIDSLYLKQQMMA